MLCHASSSHAKAAPKSCAAIAGGDLARRELTVTKHSGHEVHGAVFVTITSAGRRGRMALTIAPSDGSPGASWPPPGNAVISAEPLGTPRLDLPQIREAEGQRGAVGGETVVGPR